MTQVERAGIEPLTLQTLANPLYHLSHGCPVMLDWMRFGEFGGQVNTLNSLVLLKPFLDHFCSVAGNTISMKGCTLSAIMVGGTHQSNIHMNGRTQGFPAEHCLVCPSFPQAK